MFIFHIWKFVCFSLFYKKNFKIVCTKHLDNNLFDSLFKNDFFLANFFTKIVCRKYEKIIAISNAVKKFYLKNKIIENSDKIKVVYYGISLINKNKFKSNLDLKKKFKLSNKTFLIGTISRLVPQKSLNYLIDSFDIYNKKFNNNSKLIIVGKGFQKKQLKNYAIEKKINDKIIWIDFVEDTDNFISQLNAFALSSKYEGLGQVLLEALRAGTPIVASARGAIPEVIQNDYNGRLAPYNKPKKFKKLFDNLPKSKFKKNGHKILNLKFNEKTMFLKTMKIYKELIK